MDEGAPRSPALRLLVAAPAVARWSRGSIRRSHPDERVGRSWPVHVEFILDQELRLLRSSWLHEDGRSAVLADLVEPDPGSESPSPVPTALRFLLHDAVSVAAGEEVPLPSTPPSELRDSYGVDSPEQGFAALEGSVAPSLMGLGLFASGLPAARRLAISLSGEIS